jgi:DNA polymerase-1
MQGTTADIIKFAILDAKEYIQTKGLENDVKILLQIHDELIFEITEDKAEEVGKELVAVLERVLEKRGVTIIPLLVSYSIGKNLGTL